MSWPRSFINQISEKSVQIFLKAAIGSFLTKATGFGLLFSSQVILARLLDLKSFGIYVYVLGWMKILSIFSRIGLETSILRLLPEYKVNYDLGKVRGILKFSFNTVSKISLLVSISGFITIYSFRDALSSEMATSFYIMFVVLPIFSLSLIRRSCLQSMKHVVRAELPEGIVRPVALISIAYVIARLNSSFTAHEVWISHFIAVVLSFITGTILLRTKLPDKLETYTASFDQKKWIMISWPLLIMNSMNIVLNESALLILGVYHKSESVALFSAASRIIILVSFILLSVNSIAAPTISEYHYSGKHKELQSILSFASQILLIFTILSSLVIIVGGKLILSLFGQKYVAGYTLLVILLIGHIVKTLSGPASYLLNLTGHQNLTAKMMAITLVFSIVLSFILIPKWGEVGAAVATSLSMVLWNIILLILNLKIVNLNPSVTSLFSKRNYH